MNKLLLEKQDNLDDIKYYVGEYYECIKEFEKNKSANKSDRTINGVKRILLSIKLTKDFKKKEKEYDKILAEIKDPKKSKLPIYVGSHYLAFPINPIETQINGDTGSSIITNYYYLGDNENVVESQGLIVNGKRIEIENEIDMSSFFKLSPNFLGEISREDKKMVINPIKKYVDGKIHEKDFQSWDELRASINQDLAEKKDIFSKKDEELQQ